MVIRRLLLILLLTLTACASPRVDLAPGAPTRAFSTPAPLPPTATPAPSPVPTPTQTYQQALQPYTIEGLRQHSYQSGEMRVLGLINETRDYKAYLIEYPSDGLTIRGVMQIPTRSQPPYPVIVMNHGFFTRTEFVSGDGTDRAAEYLNIRGYLTLASDYRSWGVSDVGPSLYYSGLAIDVINLIQAIPSIPEADPTRVGLWGHSMGGAVTMKVLTILGGNPALAAPPADETESGVGGARPFPVVRAAVLYSTVSADQAEVLERWGPACIGDVIAGELRADCNSSDVIPLDLPLAVLNAYLQSVDDPAALRLVSPMNYLAYVDVPVQIHYGTLDGLKISGAPPEWSRTLFNALYDLGKPVKIIAYEGQRHSFVNEAWYDFMSTVAKFFDRTVKNPEM